MQAPGFTGLPAGSCLNLKLAVEIGTAQLNGSNEQSSTLSFLLKNKNGKHALYIQLVPSFNPGLTNTITTV